MNQLEEQVRHAVAKIGARRTARALGLSRDATMALALGIAQNGSRALAASNIARLEAELAGASA